MPDTNFHRTESYKVFPEVKQEIGKPTETTGLVFWFILFV
jgi:hypothetical protein